MKVKNLHVLSLAAAAILLASGYQVLAVVTLAASALHLLYKILFMTKGFFPLTHNDFEGIALSRGSDNYISLVSCRGNIFPISKRDPDMEIDNPS